MIDMYKIATYYSELGWSVIPLIPKSKKSLVDWSKYQTERADASELYEWFYNEEEQRGKTNEEVGIAVVLGKISNLIVYDDDNHNGKINNGFSSNIICHTGKNGFHVYYKYTDLLPKIIADHPNNIEFRTNGGIVVLPPSIHPDTEKEYEWQIDGKLKDLLDLMPVFPYEYAKQFFPKQDENFDKLARLSANEGMRDENLFKELCSKVDSVDNLQEFIELAYVINSEYKPPLKKDQIDAKIRSAWKYRKKPIIQPIEVKKPKSNIEIADQIIEWKELEKVAPSTGYENLDMIIKGFIPTHLYTLTGETNAGKTSLACNFAVNVALEGHKVLYIALEPDVHVASFLTGIFLDKNFNDIANEDYKIPIPNLSIVTQEDCPTFQHLEKIVEKYSNENYKFIVIDHIGYFAQNENNYIQEQSQLIKKLAMFTKKNQTAILQIAHPRKPQQTNTKKKTLFKYTANDIAGSVAFKQDSTEIMILHRLIDDMQSDDFNTVYKNEAIITVDKKKVSTVSNKNTAKIIFNPLSPKITEYSNYDMQREIMEKF